MINNILFIISGTSKGGKFVFSRQYLLSLHSMKSRMDLRLCMPFPFPLPHLAMCVLPQFRVVSTMQDKYTVFL
jgi:hypothetical protein